MRVPYFIILSLALLACRKKEVAPEVTENYVDTTGPSIDKAYFYGQLVDYHTGDVLSGYVLESDFCGLISIDTTNHEGYYFLKGQRVKGKVSCSPASSIKLNVYRGDSTCNPIMFSSSLLTFGDTSRIDLVLQ